MKHERPTNSLQLSNIKAIVNLVNNNTNNCSSNQLRKMGGYVEWTKRLINVQKWDVWRLGDLAIIFMWVKRLVSYVLFTWSRSSVVLFWFLFKLYYFLLEASRIISNLDRKRRSSPHVATENDDDPLVDDDIDAEYYAMDDRGYSAYGPAEVNWEYEDPMRSDLFLDKFVRGEEQRKKGRTSGHRSGRDSGAQRRQAQARTNQRTKKRRPRITVNQVGTDGTRRTSSISRGSESDVDVDIDGTTGCVDEVVGEGKRGWMDCKDGGFAMDNGETGEVAYRWDALTQGHQPREARHPVLTK